MYATQSDVRSRYREDVAVLDASDTDVRQALQDASDEIDTYLATRYGLPLAAVPGALVRVGCDIAVYRLATDAAVLTTEKRVRYEDAVKWLAGCAQGKPDLTALVAAAIAPPAPDSPGHSEGLALEGVGVEFVSAPRLFSRDSLRGVM